MRSFLTSILSILFIIVVIAISIHVVILAMWWKTRITEEEVVISRPSFDGMVEYAASNFTGEERVNLTSWPIKGFFRSLRVEFSRKCGCITRIAQYDGGYHIVRRNDNGTWNLDTSTVFFSTGRTVPQSYIQDRLEKAQALFTTTRHRVEGLIPETFWSTPSE